MRFEDPGGFEDVLREALLNDVENKLVEQANPLVFQAIQQSHEALRDFANQYPGVESVIDSLQLVDATRDTDSFTVRWGWDHPAAPFFEFGTSDHTVNGQPVLSFVWEDPPQWVREEFDQARDPGGRFESGYRVFLSEVDVTGIDETRFIRTGLRWLRLRLGGTVQI